jgi:hypothetical protein
MESAPSDFVNGLLSAREFTSASALAARFTLWCSGSAANRAIPAPKTVNATTEMKTGKWEGDQRANGWPPESDIDFLPVSTAVSRIWTPAYNKE